MPDDRVNVAIVDQNSGKKYHVQLPKNVRVAQIMPPLLKKLKLPTEGAGGEALQYDLTLETADGKARLAEDDVLAEVGVVDGATIRITPTMRAGAEATPTQPDHDQVMSPAQEAGPARYFTLQLNNPDGPPIFATDFQVDQFEVFSKQLVSILVQRGLLRSQDPFEVRIIPRADHAPDYNHPRVFQSAHDTEDGGGTLDILFEGTPPPIQTVTYITTQIRLPQTNDVIRFDWQIDSLLGGLITTVVQYLLDGDKMTSGSHFTYTLSAQAGGVPKIHPVAEVRRKTTTSQSKQQEVSTPEPPVPLDQVDVIATEDIPRHSQEEVEIVVDSVEELIKPEPQSMKAYTDAEMVGQLREGQIPIFLRRGARERARKAAGVSAGVEEEVGGFLIGKVFRDPENNQLFVDVAEIVEADQARGTYLSVDFNYDSWRQVLDRIDRDFPGKILVGWYHTHLVSQAIILPVEQPPDKAKEYVAMYVPFFSHLDHFLHRHFFPDPWYVALLLDLRCNAQVFFAWENGEIKPTQGYYLYGE